MHNMTGAIGSSYIIMNRGDVTRNWIIVADDAVAREAISQYKM